MDFQSIKSAGQPYKCPLCNNISFEEWSKWKEHWYLYHNDEFFKYKRNISNNNRSRIFHSNHYSHLMPIQSNQNGFNHEQDTPKHDIQRQHDIV